MNNHQVDRERWSRMTIQEQMGNIGSEVDRSINEKRCGDDTRLKSAIDRAFDLFDATTELLVKNKSPRTKEVLRARDQFLSLFFNNTFDDADNIEKYFMQYAIASRLSRG